MKNPFIPHSYRKRFLCRLGQSFAHSSAFEARQRQGVTIIELLIAMVIVAVLAVTLTLSVRSLRAHAAGVNCVSHLRQIGAANISYATEHRGKIAARNNSRDANNNPTPRTEWYRYIWRTYFGATNGDGTVAGDSGFCPQIICPGDPTKGGGENVGRSLQRSYNVNQRLAMTGGARSMRDVSDLSQTMYAGDIDWVEAGNSEYIIGTNTRNLDSIPRDRHSGKANFVFLDGHVESIPIDEIYPTRSRSAIFELIQPR